MEKGEIEICPKCTSALGASDFEQGSSPTPYNPVSGFVVCPKCGYRGIPAIVSMKDLPKLAEMKKGK